MDFTTATAPAWFVVVIAGVFTLLGAVTTIAGSWRNEKSRFNREVKHKYNEQVVEYGAQYIAAAMSIRELALKRINHTHDQFMEVLADEMTGVFDAFQKAREEWILVSPAKTSAEEKKLIETSTVLLVPVFNEVEISRLINEQTSAIGDFRNMIRKIRGLKPLRIASERALVNELSDDVMKIIVDYNARQKITP